MSFATCLRALRAAELAEYAAQTNDQFWEVHEALMELGPSLSDEDAEQIARRFNLPRNGNTQGPEQARARAKVQRDIYSAGESGVKVTPTFFINGRHYTGTWDECALADAMLGSLGHRIQSAAVDFVRWGPLSGILLGLATLFALIVSNTQYGSLFVALTNTEFGVQLGDFEFRHSLLHWVNHGLLTVFFFVVGLEIKREFTVGHLSTLRSGALPVMAALGGIALPALIYSAIAPPELRHGWGIPIGTDTAFAVALIVLLGSRVPVELRVFLTAAVIIDDIVAIGLIALFYSGELSTNYLVASCILTAGLIALNRLDVHNTIPYAIGGIVLWFFLHESGLHATLAGVVLAILIPARPPANINALLAQATAVIHLEDDRAREAMRTGPSEPAMRELDAIHDRIEPPADKLLRTVEPWSSYLVLPIFALANAGVEWSPAALGDNVRLMLAIMLGLVVGKPVGILAAAWLAVRTGIAVKPDAYSWRQLCGAGALGGIGFTMSLFIAGVAFPDASNYAAAKIAIFLASLIAGGLGTLILWPRHPIPNEDPAADHSATTKQLQTT
jgi:NhaA family Na+:H+ antiporter